MKKIMLFIVRLLFGLMFINIGLNKFFHHLPPPKGMTESMMKVMAAFMTIGWLMPLVGAFEIIGGILFIIPKTKALGAIIMVPIMVGIILSAINQLPSVLPTVIVLALINLWVIIENRAKYLPMVR
ncbi:DoxX family protein [Chitinophaga sp. Hz27]|uniref:DoxX family protein n=1 Tax=Chitinophaga sp. Hz27 TaxID=3347169 RepID=UPI0035D66DF5